MTGAAIATIRYSNEVPNVVTKALCVILSLIATLTVLSLLVSTMLHAFVFRDLFPNDIAIAISDHKKKKPHKKWFPLLRHGSNDHHHHSNLIEAFLKFASPENSHHSEDSLMKPSPPSSIPSSNDNSAEYWSCRHVIYVCIVTSPTSRKLLSVRSACKSLGSPSSWGPILPKTCTRSWRYTLVSVVVNL